MTRLYGVCNNDENVEVVLPVPWNEPNGLSSSNKGGLGSVGGLRKVMGVWRPGKADKADRDVEVEVEEPFWDWSWVEVGGMERAGGAGLGCIPG